MADQKFDLNTLRIASPCPALWDDMTGDAQVRHCSLCSLDVYNISEMTSDEARHLIGGQNGRVCLRLYRRSDGTVMTKDCPVGLRAFRKRVTRMASAAFAAVIGLAGISFGQKNDGHTINGSKIDITRTLSPDQTTSLIVTILDPYGAVIPGAEVVLTQGKLRHKTISNGEGIALFAGLAASKYDLNIKATGFVRYMVNGVEVRKNESARLNVSLRPNTDSVMVGVLALDEAPFIDVTSSSVTTVIKIPNDDR